MNVAALFWQALDAAPPDGVAIATSKRAITFAEMRRCVAGLANELRAVGIGPGDRIGLLGRNAPEHLQAFWAVLTVGAIPVPLNFRLTPRELKHLLAFARLRAAFVQAEYVEAFVAADEGRASTLVVWGGTGEEAAHGHRSFEAFAGAGGDTVPELADVDGSSPCTIIFTGGTSGTPKAVPRSHRNMQATLLFAPGGDLTGRPKTVLAATPFFHVAGQIAVFTLAMGGTVVIGEGGFSGEEFLRLVERYRVESAFVVPSMVAAIAAVPPELQFRVDSLRELRSGGAPLPVETAERLARRLPAAKFWNGAGSTEVGTLGAGPWDELRQRGFGCVGKPPVGQEVRIIDDAGATCPTGEVGEIIVRGPQCVSHYWGDEERSAATFRDGWAHTGDLGRIDADGYVYLIDRATDMIISGGENVYSREVEEAIHRVPRVREAAVIGVPDARWGEVPMAFVVVSDGPNDTTDIAQSLVEWLAGYKRPREIVVVDELPRTSVGKVDKRALRSRYAT